MDIGIVENTRRYVEDPHNNQSPQGIEDLTPEVRKRKNIENWTEKGHYREVEGTIGPLQNIMIATNEKSLKVQKSHRKLYLFLDANIKFKRDNSSLGTYEEEFSQLVKDRIARARWNGSEVDYDVLLLTLDEDADVNSEQWRAILRKVPELKTGSRLFIFDNGEEVKHIYDIEDLPLSNHIKLKDLSARIAIKDGPLEILGLFSNSFQQAIMNPEMFRELKETFDKKTEVMLLPTSMMPMNSKLHFERAGIVEALVASHKIGGEYVEWIDSSQEKVFTRMDTTEELYDEKHTAICTTTFFSKVFSIPQRDKPLVCLDSEPITNDGLECEIEKINSVIKSDGHERLDHQCCGRIQAEIAELVHRSMTYINAFFNDEKNKQFRPILYASVILMNESIRNDLELLKSSGNDRKDLTSDERRIPEVETRIKKMWHELCSMEKKHICGKQTMTAKRKKRQVKEGQILEGWKNATLAWKFKKGKKQCRNIKQVLEMILEDEGEIDQNIENWKNFLSDFNDVKNRIEKYSGKTERPKYGLILLSQKVCIQLQALFSETKKVTHGDLYLLNEVPGMDEVYQRLYIDGEDKRYIPASKAYEVIKKLNDALVDCNWTPKRATNSAIDPSREDLEWWRD